MYYRIKNHERLATPAQQEHIRQIFLNHGIKVEPMIVSKILATILGGNSSAFSQLFSPY